MEVFFVIYDVHEEKVSVMPIGQTCFAIVILCCLMETI